MRAADIIPEGALERALALGERVPGAFGAFCYRRLKRRLSARSVPLFGEAVRQLRPGDLAIDLGAHIGNLTAAMAATGATVHAFEPEPHAFAKLAARFADAPNVVLHQVAASDRDGRTLMHRPASQSQDRPSRAASIARRDRKMNLTDGVEVPTIDFAAFLLRLPSRVRLIKMDIEGAEWAVLRALFDRALDRFDILFVETHERFDPALLAEARRLQRLAASLERPYVNLYWK
jgi:FkbM family methyltransferase